MPDEPAPVGGLVASSGRTSADPQTPEEAAVAGVSGAWGPRALASQEARRRVSLCNLYLSMLQRFGVETDFFGASTGTLSGLELA